MMFMISKIIKYTSFIFSEQSHIGLPSANLWILYKSSALTAKHTNKAEICSSICYEFTITRILLGVF